MRSLYLSECVRACEKEKKRIFIIVVAQSAECVYMCLNGFLADSPVKRRLLLNFYYIRHFT